MDAWVVAIAVVLVLVALDVFAKTDRPAPPVEERRRRISVLPSADGSFLPEADGRR